MKRALMARGVEGGGAAEEAGSGVIVSDPISPHEMMNIRQDWTPVIVK